MGHKDGHDAEPTHKLIAISINNLSYYFLKNMFAIFEAIGQTIYMCNVLGRKPFVIIFAGNMLDFLLHKNTNK